MNYRLTDVVDVVHVALDRGQRWCQTGRGTCAHVGDRDQLRSKLLNSVEYDWQHHACRPDV